MLVFNIHIWWTKTENITTEIHFVLIFKIDVQGTSQEFNLMDLFSGRFEDVHCTVLQNCKNIQQLTFQYFTQHIWRSLHSSKGEKRSYAGSTLSRRQLGNFWEGLGTFLENVKNAKNCSAWSIWWIKIEKRDVATMEMLQYYFCFISSISPCISSHLTVSIRRRNFCDKESGT